MTTTNRMEGLCLIAIQGDMAQGGMGTHNYVYPFEPKHHKLVKKYMEAQLAFSMACSFQRDLRETQTAFFSSSRRERAEIGKLCMAELDAGHALRDAGVFRSKYDQRTTWEIAYMCELDEFKRYQPFVVIPLEEGS